MKTTIELPDALFAQARRFADAHDMTMKAMVEEGLRKVMASSKPGKPFRLRDGSVNGNGMTPEFQAMTWEQKIDAIYGDRG